jgi:beta-barrel assembly-enhancing protease
MNFYSRILILLSILIFCNCEKIADTFFSDKDDVALGQSLDLEFRSESSQIKILENPALKSYIQGIVNQILKSNEVKKKKIFPYQVTLVNDDRTINAFCAPGGFIYVYTGLLYFLENEASLAAVLAHEIAHAEKRHVRQRMLSTIGVQIILSAILGGDSSGWKDIAGQLAGNLALLSNSRRDELEADDFGFQYLRSTPYYQGSMSYFFEKILKEEKKGKFSKTFEKFLSTHPLAEDRLKENEKRIQKNKIQKASVNNLFESRYKTKLSQLIPAKKNIEDSGEDLLEPEIE